MVLAASVVLVNVACWAGFATSQVPSLSPSVAPPIVNRLDWAGVRKLNVMSCSRIPLLSVTRPAKFTVNVPGCRMVSANAVVVGPVVVAVTVSVTVLEALLVAASALELSVTS